MNHADFISKDKSLLIAPAGFGKTYSIVESLRHVKGKQLILTHTHAGVGAIKFKLKVASVPEDKFHIETITGYALKYAMAYYGAENLAAPPNSSEYFTLATEKSAKLLQHPNLATIISNSYSGLFVDEYQDCTMLQHRLILSLSELLPTRILGDPLQGIFDFDQQYGMVDLDNSAHMGKFVENLFSLEVPWRWKGQNEELGEELKEVRRKLERNETLDLRDYRSIEFRHIGAEEELYNPQKQYYKDLGKLLQSPNLLILHPDSANLNARKKIIGVFRPSIRMIEAIDDKTFYEFAKLFDNSSTRSIEFVIYTVCEHLFSRTAVKDWISETGARSRKGDYAAVSAELKQGYESLKKVNNLIECAALLRRIGRLDEIVCLRKEPYYCLCDALEEAARKGGSVYEAMLAKRNVIRRVGRRVVGRSIGTTLLTKGLEFDAVAVLNANRFDCRKNLYVALTRACKRLVVFSTSPVLSPYSI